MGGLPLGQQMGGMRPMGGMGGGMPQQMPPQQMPPQQMMPQQMMPQQMPPHQMPPQMGAMPQQGMGMPPMASPAQDPFGPVSTPAANPFF